MSFDKWVGPDDWCVRAAVLVTNITCVRSRWRRRRGRVDKYLSTSFDQFVKLLMQHRQYLWQLALNSVSLAEEYILKLLSLLLFTLIQVCFLQKNWFYAKFNI